MLTLLELENVRKGDIVLYSPVIPREFRPDEHCEQSFEFSDLEPSTGSRGSTTASTGKIRPCVVLYVELTTREVGLRAISSFGQQALDSNADLNLQQQCLSMQTPSHLHYLPTIELDGQWPNETKCYVLLTPIVARIPRDVSPSKSLRTGPSAEEQFPTVKERSLDLICELTRMLMTRREQSKPLVMSEQEYQAVLGKISRTYPLRHKLKVEKADDDEEGESPEDHEQQQKQTSKHASSKSPEASKGMEQKPSGPAAQEAIEFEYENDDSAMPLVVLFKMCRDYAVPGSDEIDSIGNELLTSMC